MFENIIITHKQRLSQIVGVGKRFVYLSEILNNSNIDEAYKTYFNAEVNNWIYEEQIRRDTNPLFDFKSDKIKLQLKELDRILYQIARFDRPTLRATIDAAVTTYLNYLLRPRTTLKWFVFRGEPTKAYFEIIKRLSFFKGYDYLIKGFIEYVNDNNLIEAEKDLFSVLEFSNIIEKVDSDFLFALQPEDFIELLMPIVRFFNPDDAKVDNKTMFPIETLIIFLDDKGIEPLRNKLEELFINKGIKKINGEMFLKQIYELLTEIEKNPELYRQNISADSSHTVSNENNKEEVPDIENDISTGISSETNKSTEESDDSEINLDEDEELRKGYQEMMELTNELMAISKALNKMKEEGKKDEVENSNENKNDAEEK